MKKCFLIALLGFNFLFAVKEAPFSIKCANGEIDGCFVVNKFGRNNDIDAGVAEDVVNQGGILVEPTNFSVVKLVSTSAFDSIGNAGADTVRIFGLDSNYNDTNEYIQMAGTDTISSIIKYWFIYRAYVVNAGDSAGNVGDIKVIHDTTDAIVAQISNGDNQTLLSAYQVPANKTLFIDHIWFTINGSNSTAEIDVYMFTKEIGGVWRLRTVKGLTKTGVSEDVHEYHPMLKINSKTKIKIQAISSVNNTDVSSGFDGYIMWEGD